VGSIGKATDIGWEVFEPPFVPVIVGAPALKRYLIFGNLFATVGAETFRLDRHPTMSKHPVTPMDEADLRRHLARQTRKSMALFDLLHLAASEAALDEHLQNLRAGDAQIILFDTLDDSHLARVGRLLWNVAGEERDKSLFVVGSSGVEYALTAHWLALGLVDKPQPFPSPGPVEQIIVVSGSASPGTANQISWGLANGFMGLRLNPRHLLSPEQAEAQRASIVQQAMASLGNGQSVLLYTAHGPDDPAIAETHAWLQTQGIPASEGGRWLQNSKA
jgi:uncharacterized protein YgbK (DUF1537 family)